MEIASWKKDVPPGGIGGPHLPIGGTLLLGIAVFIFVSQNSCCYLGDRASPIVVISNYKYVIEQICLSGVNVQIVHNFCQL